MCSNVFGMYHISNYLEQVTESEIKYIERICREHHVIINIQISGSCEECKKMENTKKNRFQNIECWDSTQVCLKKKGSNYIHANYVDGFEQVRKFIVTQEPMDNTLEDYWSMVWRTGARVIVMLNGTDGPAVPSVSDYNQLEGFTVTVTSIAVQKDYVEMGMNVLNINTMRSNTVHFFKYLSWPKEGITDISTLISFMIAVNERHQYYMKPALMNPPSPIVIYSTPGIERAPTFCAVDISYYCTGGVSITKSFVAITLQLDFSWLTLELTFARMANNLLIFIPVSDYIQRAKDPKWIDIVVQKHLQVINLTIASTCDIFYLPRNRKKNRNMKYPCWDISRVVLKSKKGSDYINTNYMAGIDGRCKFIAT
ncbi:hypothetical protein G9C98_005482 [Cotesia typhae]|uniref:Tyrosine-protein phosphatase domain-containing protein n=1 Tax=Cotesia typhae TaxID=2053667 RepID=A0A8J5QVS7_9HYME|nr:hypothetical protein G9C98_005482 [Cotesia typhae]